MKNDDLELFWPFLDLLDLTNELVDLFFYRVLFSRAWELEFDRCSEIMMKRQISYGRFAILEVHGGLLVVTAGFPMVDRFCLVSREVWGTSGTAFSDSFGALL